ncbi:hypothetical protein MMC20_003327 [Loxospora ochrophaea]|nr:hypothetical protein [Loxospora ochrophaea]
MSHRADRVREREREREADREPGRPRREQPREPRRLPLNEYFVDGEGIHREVMQMEICKYLGAEAISRPGEYNGRKGYMIKALRPFTPDMLDDLKTISQDYVSERNNYRDQGYDRESIPSFDQSLTYEASRRQNFSDSRYQSPGTSGPSGSPYPPGSTYSQGQTYPPGSRFPQDVGYYTAAGLAPGFPATAADGGRFPLNYTHEPTGEFPPGQGFPNPAGPYGPGPQPRDPRAQGGYYVSSPQDIPGFGPTIGERYPDENYSSMQPSAGVRGGYAPATRGPMYDPMSAPRDTYGREQPRDYGRYHHR